MKTPPVYLDPFDEALKEINDSNPEGSEFSQNPQEFREKGIVSPFVMLSSGVRKIKINMMPPKQNKFDREPF